MLFLSCFKNVLDFFLGCALEHLDEQSLRLLINQHIINNKIEGRDMGIYV